MGSGDFRIECAGQLALVDLLREAFNQFAEGQDEARVTGAVNKLSHGGEKLQHEVANAQEHSRGKSRPENERGLTSGAQKCDQCQAIHTAMIGHLKLSVALNLRIVEKWPVPKKLVANLALHRCTRHRTECDRIAV